MFLVCFLLVNRTKQRISSNKCTQLQRLRGTLSIPFPANEILRRAFSVVSNYKWVSFLAQKSVWVSWSQSCRQDCSVVLSPVLLGCTMGYPQSQRSPGLCHLCGQEMTTWFEIITWFATGIFLMNKNNWKEITTSKAIHGSSCNPSRNNPDLFSRGCILLDRASIKRYSQWRSKEWHNGYALSSAVCQAGWRLMGMLG